MNRASRTAGVPSPECATATAAVTGPGSEGTYVGVDVHGVGDGGGGGSEVVVMVVKEEMVMAVHERALSCAHPQNVTVDQKEECAQSSWMHVH